MPVMVEFSNRNGLPSELRQECGPYRSVQLSGDELFAFDGFQPFRLAERNPDGSWQVRGLEGLHFTSVLVLPPVEQRAADLEAAESGESDLN